MRVGSAWGRVAAHQLIEEMGETYDGQSCGDGRSVDDGISTGAHPSGMYLKWVASGAEQEGGDEPRLDVEHRSLGLHAGQLSLALRQRRNDLRPRGRSVHDE